MTVKELKHKSNTVWSLVREALATEERDYTTLTLKRAVFMLSLPMILEMVMESAFAFFDALYVGRIGSEAVATVGLTESMMFVLYSIGIGISMGATALIARRIGEKNKKDAGTAAIQALWLTILVSVIISVIGIIYAPQLLALMNAEQSVIDSGSGYTRILIGGNLSVMLLFLINAIFRGGGDASIAMRTLVLANLLNIALDPLFIFGLPFLGWDGFGVEGAAIATTIGRSLGVLYQIRMLSKGKANMVITRENIIVRWATIKSILRISLGGVGQFLIESASWIFIARVVARFGTEATAGYTLALRVVITSILPFFGMANAAATLVGQNLGAKQPERAEKSAWFTAHIAGICLAILSVLYFTFAPQIIWIFTNEVEVIALGSKYLRIICVGYVFFAYGMVISQSINGAGDTATPTWLNLVAFWAVQIPLAYGLSVLLDMGAEGAMWAITVAFSLHAMLSMWVFKWGKWKLKEV